MPRGLRTALIATAALLVGLAVGTTWAVLVDVMDPDGEYADLQRRAEHQRRLDAERKAQR